MQMVARRTVTLAGLLGLGLAGVLALVSDPLPQLFNPSPGVMAAIRPIYPFVILTQPLNALAFVWDGVLYGAGGFPYAATVSVAFLVSSWHLKGLSIMKIPSWSKSRLHCTGRAAGGQ